MTRAMTASKAQGLNGNTRGVSHAKAFCTH